MINYTDSLTRLMTDIVSRVPVLSPVDLDAVLVFARQGRSNREGAFATCHCLSLPPSEPGYYYWRDRSTGLVTRRSEWFVTRSPVVSVGARTIKYMISFSLPRFCDQSLARSRKERYYRRAGDTWIAKLDTVVHELYHIDPEEQGIRRIARGDGTYQANCHGPRFLERVADLVTDYLDSGPDPDVFDFLRHDFRDLEATYGGVVATSFRTFPSFPQRFIETLPEQPADDQGADVVVEPVRPHRQPTRYTEDDLFVRQFLRDTSRRVGSGRAA
jgi:hypothetical protein